MENTNTVYAVEGDKSVSQFVEDFAKIVKTNDFVINNRATMNMKKNLQIPRANLFQDPLDDRPGLLTHPGTIPHCT